MRDEHKTREQLLLELEEKRQRIAELEALEIQHKQADEALRQSEERYRTLVESERKQRQFAEALQEAAATLSRTLDLDRVLDRILEQVEQVVAGDAFNVMLIQGEDAQVVRRRGYEKLGVAKRRSTFPVPIARYPYLLKMVQTRAPVLVPDTGADPDWVQEEDREWLQSYVGAPIHVTGLAVGFLNVNGTRPGQFGPDDARRLEVFAHHAAIAVENARLYQETTRRLAQTQVLREAMLAAASTLDFDQVLERTLQTVRAAMGVEFLWFALPDREGGGLRAHPSHVGYSIPLEQVLLPLGGSVCGRVFETGQPMVIGDVRELPYYVERHPEVRSELAVPVRVGGRVIGVLNVGSSVPNAFDNEDRAFYTAVAGQLGVALEDARLYQQIRDQADELAAAVAQLEELDRLKSEFVQNVSHELRSPLALIRGYAEVLDAGELGELRPEQQKPISIIARRSRILSDLVKDITLILEAESSPPEPEPVSMDELTRTVVEDFQIAARQAGVSLRTDIPSRLPAVSGSSAYLRRVVDNLLDNAVKFTPVGGTITVRVQQQGEQVALEVRDTGIGIPPDQQGRVFERFYQIDGSVKRRYGGMGLGLAVVKEIVEIYGGSVNVQSKVSEGTTFNVVLPIHSQ